MTSSGRFQSRRLASDMSSALEPWAFYGAGETIIEEFTANPKNDTLSVYALDILNGNVIVLANSLYQS